MKSAFVEALVVLAAFGPSAIVRAQEQEPTQDWPRFHFGVGLGDSRLGIDPSSVEVTEEVRAKMRITSSTARKFVAGFRPLRIFGAEVQFIDFGGAEHAVRMPSQGGQIGRLTNPRIFTRASSEAKVLSALLFIPEPRSGVDVYGKIGAAQLDESLKVSGTDTMSPGCSPYVTCDVDVAADRTGSHAYVGFGARFKVARLASVRAEYEAIDGDEGGNTRQVSLGIALEF